MRCNEMRRHAVSQAASIVLHIQVDIVRMVCAPSPWHGGGVCRRTPASRRRTTTPPPRERLVAQLCDPGDAGHSGVPLRRWHHEAGK